MRVFNEENVWIVIGSAANVIELNYLISDNEDSDDSSCSLSPVDRSVVLPCLRSLVPYLLLGSGINQDCGVIAEEVCLVAIA